MGPESRTKDVLFRKRTIVAVVLALLLGMALGPASVSAASAAIRIANWPSLMKVSVVAMPPKTPLHIGHAVNLDGPFSIFGFTSWYTVPAGRYLTVTSISVGGSGAAPVGNAELDTNSSGKVFIPTSLVSDNGTYWVSGESSGQHIYAPGTVLGFKMQRATKTSDFSGEVTLDGYLSSNP